MPSLHPDHEVYAVRCMATRGALPLIHSIDEKRLPDGKTVINYFAMLTEVRHFSAERSVPRGLLDKTGLR